MHCCTMYIYIPSTVKKCRTKTDNVVYVARIESLTVQDESLNIYISSYLLTLHTKEFFLIFISILHFAL